ncbi:rhomboid-like protein [Trypanosoma grayi]|uniref:rhomboid-like protein n=1 Tax=Trypanosoma grayi TaxID=71804 RepID=UPI0004F406CC|nr:rhomboid-like protein [Trypanosoma grayi]KEG13335.1 rhomboid-like protein [Trypanosoma grayi]
MPGGEGVVSKVLAAFLCVTTALSLATTAVPRVFGLVPAHTFSVHSYPWNVVSYILVEQNILLCVCSVGYMLTVGVTVEEDVGTSTFLQLVVVTAIATAAVLLVLSAVLYQVGFFWFLQCYCGAWPIAAALLVPWVAASPAAGAFPTMLSPKVQRQHVPTMLLIFALVVDIVFRKRYKITEEDVDSQTIFPGSVFILAFVGLWTSWLLQRLFRLKATIALGVLLYPVASVCFGAKSQLGNSNNNNSHAGDTLDTGAVSISVLHSAANMTLLPGSTEEEAERRRSIALAALSTRLQQAVPTQAGERRNVMPV